MSAVVFLWGIISSATTITARQLWGPGQQVFGERRLQMDTRWLTTTKSLVDCSGASAEL